MIEIVEVRTKKEFRQFIRFPNILYRDDSCYIQEPYVVQQFQFDPQKNPFFLHSKVDCYLAKNAKQVVGRIALIRNNNHILHTGEQCGFFGFFESIDDYEVAEALLREAVNWLKRERLTFLRGPENFTTNESCGMLFSGFDTPPVVMMPYNKPYYNDFLVRFGFEKEMDLSSYELMDDKMLQSPSITRIMDRITLQLKDADITIRPINYKTLGQEILPLLGVYNQANKDNWGFLPLTETEFKTIAHQFSQFVPEKLILIVEKDHHPIGFIIALPDLNQVFSHSKSGNFWPFGMVKFLWYKRRINKTRILILGVVDEYRNRGIDLILYKRIKENCVALGMYRGEAGYVMDNNLRMKSILEKVGAKRIKRYRIYKWMHDSPL
jgi:hypothetical protein